MDTDCWAKVLDDERELDGELAESMLRTERGCLYGQKKVEERDS